MTRYIKIFLFLFLIFIQAKGALSEIQKNPHWQPTNTHVFNESTSLELILPLLEKIETGEVEISYEAGEFSGIVHLTAPITAQRLKKFLTEHSQRFTEEAQYLVEQGKKNKEDPLIDRLLDRGKIQSLGQFSVRVIEFRGSENILDDFLCKHPPTCGKLFDCMDIPEQCRKSDPGPVCCEYLQSMLQVLCGDTNCSPSDWGVERCFDMEDRCGMPECSDLSKNETLDIVHEELINPITCIQNDYCNPLSEENRCGCKDFSPDEGNVQVKDTSIISHFSWKTIPDCFLSPFTDIMKVGMELEFGFHPEGYFKEDDWYILDADNKLGWYKDTMLGDSGDEDNFTIGYRLLDEVIENEIYTVIFSMEKPWPRNDSIVTVRSQLTKDECDNQYYQDNDSDRAVSQNYAWCTLCAIKTERLVEFSTGVAGPKTWQLQRPVYPKLAGFALGRIDNEEEKDKLSRYDLVALPAEAFNVIDESTGERFDPLSWDLRTERQGLIALGYYDPVEIDVYNFSKNLPQNILSPAHDTLFKLAERDDWLFAPGTKLRSNFLKGQTILNVEDTNRFKFYSCDSVDDCKECVLTGAMVDNEHFFIKRLIDNHRIEVYNRGFKGKFIQQDHFAGAYVAPHNEFWIGPPAHFNCYEIGGTPQINWPSEDIMSYIQVNWMMNMTPGHGWIPKISGWLIDNVLQPISRDVPSCYWNGLMLDNFFSVISWLNPVAPQFPLQGQVDADNNRIADDNQILNTQWANGHTEFLRILRNADSQDILIANIAGGLWPDWYKYLNGRLFEMFPNKWEGGGGWFGNFKNYEIVSDIAQEPVTIILNGVDENLVQNPNNYDMQKARFLLATALMDQGYYVFDGGPWGHDIRLWLDEYGGEIPHLKGTSLMPYPYLGYPLGPVVKVIPDGPEMIEDGGFLQDDWGPWRAWVEPGVDGQWDHDAVEIPPEHFGIRSARATIETAQPVDYYVSLDQGNWTLIENTDYVLTFYAKASKSRLMAVSFLLNHPPWWPNLLYDYGFIGLSPTWQKYVMPFTAVLDGPVFGLPVKPYQGTDWHVSLDFLEEYPENSGQYHLGEDWNWNSGDDDCGLPITASKEGTVIYADIGGGTWGNVVIVDHALPSGHFESLYGHLQDVFVTPGQIIEKGQQIGTCGKGGTESCHLHWEIRDPQGPNPGPGYTSDRNDPLGRYDPSSFAGSLEGMKVSFAVANEDGQVWISDVSLKERNDDLYYREFENGEVVVNASDKEYITYPEEGYVAICGGQDPAINDGKPGPHTLKSQSGQIFIKKGVQISIPADACN